MEYSYGYVAFIDILGFSNLVLNEDSLEIVDKLFRFINSMQKNFNSVSDFSIKVAFFSDSIVITTNDINPVNIIKLFSLIHQVEIVLLKNTGLYFRGGIIKGKYYYSNTTVFGPAVINAYKLENKANYSRVLIEKHLAEELLSDKSTYDFALDIIKDYDGEYYFNSFYYDVISAVDEKKPLTIEMIYKKIQEVRDSTIDSIKKYLHTGYIEKYLWRARAFNRSLSIITSILDKWSVIYQKSDKISFIKLRIDIEKIAEESGENNDQL